MEDSNIYHSPYPLPSVPIHQSVSEFLLTSDPDDTSPDTVIFTDFDSPQHLKVTYAGLRKKASEDGATLRSRHGLKQGDVVCIYAYNSVNWARIAHATLWAGGCLCGVNPLATKFELEHYFKIAEPKVIVVDSVLLENVKHAISKLRVSPEVIVIDDAPGRLDTSQLVYPRDFDAQTGSIMPLSLSKRDNRLEHATMCFSSGTSGAPKAVIMSHHNLIAQMLGVRSTNPFLHSNRVREVFFPSFAHVYGLVSAILVPAYIRATVLRLVPAAAVRMVKDPGVSELDLRSVQAVMCSGAPLSDSTVSGLKDMLAPEAGVLNGYGMTEATVTLLRETRRDKAASVGRPSAGVSIRIVDDTLKDVPPGDDGECLVRGPTVFLGYKNDPTATAEARIQDGWLRTGDIARVDNEGFFYLTGRKKELIKFRGNQIAPAELEAVLLMDPRVADAGVCGVYDPAMETEIPVGFVTLKAEHLSSPGSQERVLRELRGFANGRVAPYKKLRRDLVHVAALPKNASGKLLRRKLNEWADDQRKKRSKL